MPRLLNRTPNGYVLTLAGQSVRGQAERLEAEALSLERNVSGRDAQLAGLVRITCAETVASYLLAPCLAVLHRQHPDIMVELTSDLQNLSLSMREADISVRLSRPEQHELAVRRIGDLGFGLYASPAYLERHGELGVEAGCAGHYLITQSNDIEVAAQTRWLAELAPRARIAVQTTSHEAAVSAALHGGGLACLTRFRADREAGLTRLPVFTAPAAAVWLAVHRDNRANARIRACLTHITQSVRSLAGQLLSGDHGLRGRPATPSDGA